MYLSVAVSFWLAVPLLGLKAGPKPMQWINSGLEAVE